MAKYTLTGPFVANTTPYYNTAAFLNGVEGGITTAQTQVSDVNAQTGTTYTLVLADAGKTVEMNNAAGNTLTIPPNASVAFPVNTLIEVHQTGAGATSVVGGAGVTLNPISPIAVPGQWKTLRLRKRATNTWVAEMIGPQVTGAGEFVNLARDYGVASGQDITTVLQTVAALTTPRTVYLPAGDYTISGLVNFTRPVDFVGDGPNATKLQKTADSGQVQWTGTRGSNVAITADVASGASTLSFVTTGFAAGDFLNLHSSEVWPWSTALANHGEIVRIKTVDSGSVVTLYSPTVDAYTVANSATVNKMTFLTGGSIQRMTVYQTTPLSTGTNNGLVRVVYGRGFEARDVTFLGMDQFAVCFDSCLEGTANRLILTDAYWNDATNTYYAYGILMRGCTQSVTVSNVSARNAQVVNGGGDSGGGPRFIKVADCVGTEGSQLVGDTTIYKPLFATHGDCMEWEFSDCLAYSSRGSGWEIKGSDHVFTSIMAHNISSTGIFCLPESSRIRFFNPNVRDINGTGLIITQDSSVHGGSIRDCDSRGLRVDGSGCTVVGTEVRNAGRTGNRDAFYLNTGANNTMLRDITARDMPTATSYVVNGVASLTGNVIHFPRRINVQSGANTNVSAAVYTGGTAYTL